MDRSSSIEEAVELNISMVIAHDQVMMGV